MPNTFDLDKMNHALYVANVDVKSQEIAEDSFKLMSDFSFRHGRISDKDFGSTKKDEILGMVVDDMAKQILSPQN